MERSCIGNSALLCKLRMLMPNTAVMLVSHFSLTENSLCGRPKDFYHRGSELAEQGLRQQCIQEQQESDGKEINFKKGISQELSI